MLQETPLANMLAAVRTHIKLAQLTAVCVLHAVGVSIHLQPAGSWCILQQQHPIVQGARLCRCLLLCRQAGQHRRQVQAWYGCAQLLAAAKAQPQAHTT